jgi:hypothetical protein
MCAPLRSGDTVFGLLRVSQGRKAWTAGELKLVTSMASNAASAISHALLHRDQLRRQALRGQIERFVSPLLLGAALESPGVGSPERAAVLYCDLGSLARSITSEASAREVLDSLLLATSIAVDALLAVEATVNVSQSEMLVAAFPHRHGFEASAKAAVTAARQFGMVLEAALGARPGVGLAAADASDEAAFLVGVGTAAMLQSIAEGRLLIDDAIAETLDDPELGVVARETLDLSTGPMQAHEVTS